MPEKEGETEGEAAEEDTVTPPHTYVVVTEYPWMKKKREKKREER
jgi:hypothetical protein